MRKAQPVGDRIKFNRESRHWTQAELAEKVGVSRETIVKWESGKRLIKAEDVISLSNVFNLDCHFLLTGEHAEYTTVAADLGLSDLAISTLTNWAGNRKMFQNHVAHITIDELENGETKTGNISIPESLDTLSLLLETHNGWRLLSLIYRFCFADFNQPYIDGQKVKTIQFLNRSESPDGKTEINISLLRFAILKAIETELEDLRSNLLEKEEQNR